jgi:hypothetical protein
MNEKITTCHDCHGFKCQNINIYLILTIFLCGLTLFLAHWIATTPMWVEIIVKGARGAKVKVFFQILHMTRVIFALVYTLNFIFQIFHVTLHFKYKYILIRNLLYIMYIMHSYLLSHIYEQLLLKQHFQNP